MGAMVSQIPGVSIVCSTVCWAADQRKHQRSASLAFVRGIHRRWPVDSPHKGLLFNVTKNPINVIYYWASNAKSRHHDGAMKGPHALNIPVGNENPDELYVLLLSGVSLFIKKCTYHDHRPSAFCKDVNWDDNHILVYICYHIFIL